MDAANAVSRPSPTLRARLNLSNLKAIPLMPSDPISCPYCNALLPEIRPAPGSTRLLCPRCGESFPYRGSLLSPESPGALSQARENGADPLPQGIATPAWSNRKLALVLLAGMGVVGSVFLVAALLTQTVRREHDLKL